MICLILYISYTKSHIYTIWYKFDTVLSQFLETGTSDRCLTCIVQRLRFSGFGLYPLLFFLYSPFNDLSSETLDAKHYLNSLVWWCSGLSLAAPVLWRTRRRMEERSISSNLQPNLVSPYLNSHYTVVWNVYSYYTVVWTLLTILKGL